MPFKWYPKEEILPHAAAWRLLDLSESNGRPVDLVIASKFPTYFARHPNKVAWLIHQYRAAYELCGTRVQRLRAHRARRRPARHADAARHGDARRVPRGLHQRAEHRRAAGEVQRPPGRAAVSPAASGAAARRRARTATTCCRSAGSNRSSASISSSRRWRASTRRSAWSSPATERSASNVERAADAGGRRRPRHVPRHRRRRRSDRALCGRAGGGLSAVRRGLRLRHARGVSSRASRSITCTDSGGPNEFVVDGVNGFVCDAGRRRRWRRRSTGSPATAARRGDGRRRLRGRAAHHLGRRDRKAASCRELP